MEIRVLGETELIGALDATIKLAGATQMQSVLGLLICRHGRRVTRDQIVDQIWPDHKATQGRLLTVSGYLSKLRRVIGHDALRRGAQIGLYLDPDRIDLFRFERLVEEALEQRHTSPANTCDLLRRALRLWRGRPFTSMSDDVEEIEMTRQYLERRYRTALDVLYEAELANHRHQHVLEELVELSRREPDHAPFWEHRIMAHRRCHDTVGLAQAVTESRAHFAELNLELPPSLVDLIAGVEIPRLDSPRLANRRHPIITRRSA